MLPLTFSRRHLSHPPRTAQPALDRLPAEILLEVTSHLTSRADVLRLSKVVRLSPFFESCDRPVCAQP